MNRSTFSFSGLCIVLAWLASSSTVDAFQIREMANQDRADQEVVELIQPFVEQASLAMKMSGPRIYAREYRQMAKRLSAPYMGDALARFLKKKSEHVPENRLDEFRAYANELTGQTKSAVEGYRKVVQKNPGHDAARMRLMLLEAELGIDSFKEHFPKFESRALIEAELATSIREYLPKTGYWEQRTRALEQWSQRGFRIVEQIVDNFDLVVEHDAGQDWVQRIVESLARSAPPGDGRRGFYHAFSVWRPMEVAKLPPGMSIQATLRVASGKQEAQAAWSSGQEFIAKRNRILGSLADKMSRTPRWSALGFTTVLALKEATGQPLDAEFRKYSSEVLLRQVTAGARNWAPHELPELDQSDRVVRSLVPLRTPVSFLARELGLDGTNQDKAIKKLIAQLKRASAKQLATELETRYQLYRSPKDDFARLATSVVQTSQTDGAKSSVAPRLRWVYEIWRDRGCDSDITGLMLMAPHDTALWTQFLTTLCENGQRSSIPELLKQHHATFEKTPRDARGGASYSEFLVTLTDEPELILFAAKQLSLGEVLPFNRAVRVRDKILDIIRILLRHRPAQLQPWLERVGILNQLESLDPIMITKVQKTLLGNLVKSGIVADCGYHGTVHLSRVFGPTEDPSFCQIIFSIQFAGKFSLLNTLGQDLELLESLPASQKDLIRAFGRDLIGRSGIIVKANRYGLLARKFLFEGFAKPPIITRLLAAKSADELVDDPRQELDKFCSQALQSVDPGDPETFFQLMKKSIELMDQCLPPDEFSEFLHRPYFPTPRKRMYTRLFRQLSFSDAVRVYAKTYDAGMPRNLGTSLDFSTRFGFGEELSLGITRIRQSLKEKREVTRVPDFFVKLAEEFDTDDTTAILPELAVSMARVNYRLLGPVDETSFPAFNKTWNLALQAAPVTDSRWHELYEKEYPVMPVGSCFAQIPDNQRVIPTRLKEGAKYQQELIAYIKNPDHSLATRYKVAKFLAELDQTLPAEFVFDCIEVICLAGEAGFVNFDSYNYVLQSALELKTHARFKDVTSKFAQQWASELADNSASHHWKRRSKEFPIAIELLSELDQLELFDDLVDQAKHGKITCTPDVLVGLIENSRFKPARTLCRRLWDSPYRVARLLATERLFTRALEAKLEEFVSSFEDENAQFLARTFFSGLKNTAQSNQAPKTTVDQRLAKLTGDFDEVIFENADDKLVMLLGLVQASRPEERILDELGNALDQDNVRNDIFLTYASACFRNYDYQPMFKFRDSCAKAAATGRPSASFFRTHVKSYLSSSQIVECYCRSSEKGKTKLSRTVAKLADPQQLVSLLTQSNVLLHALRGDSDKLIKQYQDFPGGRTRYGNYLVFHPDELWADIGSYMRYQDRPFDASERFEFVEAVLKLVDVTSSGMAGIPFDHHLKPGQQHRQYAFYPLMQHGLLSKSEVLDHGSRFADLVWVNGDLYRHLGKMQLEQGNAKLASELLLKGLHRRSLELFVPKEKLVPYKRELAQIYQKLGETEKRESLTAWMRGIGKWRRAQLRKYGAMPGVPKTYINY